MASPTRLSITYLVLGYDILTPNECLPFERERALRLIERREIGRCRIKRCVEMRRKRLCHFLRFPKSMARSAGFRLRADRQPTGHVRRETKGIGLRVRKRL